MSALPEGISTALVHMDAPLSFIGEPGRLHVEINSSASLVWSPTGTPIANFDDILDLTEGEALEIHLPHIDQAGFEDGNGNAFTGWYYTVTVTYELDGQIREFPTRDFQVLVGQDSVDLALVPSGESYVPEVAPILPVTSWNGQTGAVTASKADVGLERVDNTNDAEKPVSTAAQAALDLKAPKANPAFTGTVTGVTKDMVGLGSVDNTSDAAKPISTAAQAALDAKAPKASPTFTGTVTLPATTNGLSKSNVGLGNVDNTADAAKPVSTAQQAALDAKADKNNPAFTGTVTGVSKGHVGLGSVDNTSDAAKPVSTAQQAALDAKAPKNNPVFTGTVQGITKDMVGLANAPTAMAEGSVVIGSVGASGGSFSQAVTFPVGRFSAPPRVIPSTDSTRLNVGVSAVTATGFTLLAVNWSPGASSGANGFWVALGS
jgi:hypothetical protein